MVGEARFHHDCLRCVTCRSAETIEILLDIENFWHLSIYLRTGLDGKMVTLDKENRPYCSKCYDK